MTAKMLKGLSFGSLTPLVIKVTNLFIVPLLYVTESLISMFWKWGFFRIEQFKLVLSH